MIRCLATRRRRKNLVATGVIVLLFLLLLIFCNYDNIYDDTNFTIYRQISREEGNPLVGQHAFLWRSLFELILNNEPKCNKTPDLVVPQTMRIHYDPTHRHPRPDVLWMDPPDIEHMKSAHANFVSDLDRLPSGLAYNPGTRGIVTTASESLLNVLTVSLRMLRKTNSDLPLEVFLDKRTAYSNAFCTRIFPHLDAKCRYLSEIFDVATTQPKLNNFQYKIFSILFSSFERVLFLDADAWPLADPESLFHSLPFTETGLIFWPDFWYMSESPYFFDIIKTPPASIPFLDERPATESSIMLYDKTKHEKSLMLAAYYNYYGPEYYYILQSQGGEGQGDKETFLWAATALKEQYYFVHHPVRSLGHHDSEGEYVGTAMIQYDPVMDFFQSTSEVSRREVSQSQLQLLRAMHDLDHIANLPDHPPPIPAAAQPSIASTGSILTDAKPKYKPKPLFVHANVPKFDPTTIFNTNIRGIHSPTRDINGSFVRCWAPEEDSLQIFGFDVEKRFWTAMEEVVCKDLPGLVGHVPGAALTSHVKMNYQKSCAMVREYIKEVFV